MTEGHTERGTWGSSVGFILAAAGSAVGLGNIWRFPYVVGENGGGAFVLLYILCVVFICAPVMIAELALGRHTQRNPVGAFRTLVPGSPWKVIGALGVLTGVGILSFYSVVAGWTLQYAVRSVVTPNYIRYSQEEAERLWTSFGNDPENLRRALAEEGIITQDAGSLSDEQVRTIWQQFTSEPRFGVFREKMLGRLHNRALFEQFASHPFLPTVCLLMFILLTGAVVAGGVGAGIERWSRILMPILFVLLLVLAVRAVTLPGASRGLAFYLKPELSKLSVEAFARALGQAFFSLSLGMGTILTYGSYLSRRENIIRSAGWICLSDTLVAFIAGLVIFPTLFAMGFRPDAGVSLAFVVLPSIFAHMPAGALFGAAFFLLLCVAALTSTISLLEVPVAYLVDEHHWGRKSAVVATCAVAFLLGIGSALSTGAVPVLTRIPGVGVGVLEFLNALFGNYALSVGALGIALFVGYRWGIRAVAAEIEQHGNKFLFRGIWSVLIRYVSPLGIAIVLAYILITGKYF
ncbi:MAG: sodium-dependent transporter [candidate division KSB1 bacterium]|nr:sodium-dependent transporter [candidate division KSB1 bacterium]